MLYSFFNRNNIGQFEECGLTNHVDTTAKSDVLSNLSRIDDIEFKMFVGNRPLHGSR